MALQVNYVLRPAPAVDANALEVLAGRQPGLDHSLAFEMLDRQLGLLAKASGVLNLYLGKALGPMLDRGYQKMGYANAQDYCVERLGFCKRSAELARKQAAQFDRHPAVRTAYLDGQINESAARLILGHLDAVGGDPAELIALGATSTVRSLKERLRELAGEGPGSRSDRDGAEAAGERIPAAGTWRTYRLPAAWIATWEMVVEHFRRAEEADLEPWQILELLAADFLAGRPLDLPMPVPEMAVSHETAASPGYGCRFDASGIDWRRMLEEVSHCWMYLPDPLRVVVEVDAKLGMPLPDDIAGLHTLLTDLVVCRRRLDLYVGRMLRTMADYGIARMAQFSSIWHYAAERLGLGSSTTSRLIKRDRGLVRRRTIFEAIEAGRIGLTQADLILSLPDIVPDGQWIAWAEIRTCRSLEDAVSDLRAAARLDPLAIWRRGWHPPATGEILTSKSEALESAGVGAPISAPPRDAAHSSVVAIAEAVKWLPMFSQGGESLRIFVPDDVVPVVEAAENLASEIAGRVLPPEAALVALMVGAEAGYSAFERKRVAQRRRLLRKSRYRCAFPGCRVRRGLHSHHVVYRSHGGGDSDENRILLCGFHHLRGVHDGWLRIRAKGCGFVFEVDLEGYPAALVFEGDRQVS